MEPPIGDFLQMPMIRRSARLGATLSCARYAGGNPGSGVRASRFTYSVRSIASAAHGQATNAAPLPTEPPPKKTCSHFARSEGPTLLTHSTEKS